jgi:hypothetical protein
MVFSWLKVLGANRVKENTCPILSPAETTTAVKNKRKTTGCFTPETTGVSTHRVAVLRDSCLPIQSAIGGEYL